jgi:hypothetical protein
MVREDYPSYARLLTDAAHVDLHLHDGNMVTGDVVAVTDSTVMLNACDWLRECQTVEFAWVDVEQVEVYRYEGLYNPR